MMMLTQVPVAMDHFTFICLYPLSLLPLNHLATFVRSELCNPAKHFSATFSQTRAPFNSSSVKSGIRGEEQPIYAINFSVQQMQWGI